jgi:hypothetical protein
MKKFSIFFFLFLSIFIFSQDIKELSIQDSLSLKYPDRKKVSITIGEIFYKSEASKKAVSQILSKKFSAYDFKTVTKNDVEIAKTYYKLHFMWILIDNTLMNFTDDEIDEIKHKISSKKTDHLLIQKFRDVEQKSIEKFQREF